MISFQTADLEEKIMRCLKEFDDFKNRHKIFGKFFKV